ncbi:MAG: hypothetical protein HQK65_17045 [Desulfamplus sp.]|nr:hypothetical protein [Desulfamplus sp.]
MDIEKKIHRNDDIQVICTTTGTRFAELIRLFCIFCNSKYQHPLHVKDSVISQPIGTKEFFGTMHLSSKLLSANDDKNPKSLNLFLDCSQNDLKRLKFNGTAAVAILLDSKKKRYIFTDGNRMVEVGKSEYGKLPSPPKLIEEKINGNRFELDDKMAKSLKSGASKFNCCALALYGDQLEKVKFNNGDEHCFTPKNAIKHLGKEPDKILISYNLMKVVGNKDITLTLKNDDEDNYWLVTESTINLDTKAIIYEQLF